MPKFTIETTYRVPVFRQRTYAAETPEAACRLAIDDDDWSGRCTMSIPDHARANFQTLLRAAADGNLALMECLGVETGQPRYVICAIGRDGSDYVFTPFGHLAEGNPYDVYRPPDPDDPGGFLPTARPTDKG